MKSRCPSCESPVRDNRVNEYNVATCWFCGATFAVPGRAQPPERAIPMPKGITIESGEPPLRPPGGYREAAPTVLPELVVRRRWFRWTALFLTFFCVVWNGFLVAWYAIAIDFGGGLFGGGGFGGGGFGTAQLFALVFPLVHVVVGLGLTYYTAALWLNSTALRIHDDRLTVRHGPLPWGNQHDLPVASIRQLYFIRRTQRTKNGTSTTWQVHARTHDHRDLCLLKGLTREEEARYIEWVIEEHLGIEDEPSMNRA